MKPLTRTLSLPNFRMRSRHAALAAQHAGSAPAAPEFWKMTVRMTSVAVVLAVAALTLAGCASIATPTATHTPDAAGTAADGIPVADLVGAWHLTSFSSGGVVSAVRDEKVTLFVYENGRLVERTSICAPFNGYYIPADGELVLRNDVAVIPACASNVMPGNLMSSGFTMVLAEGTLTLRSTTAEVRTPDPDEEWSADVFTYERSSLDPGPFLPQSGIELSAPAIPLARLVGEWKLAEYTTVGGEQVTVDDPADRVLIYPDGRLVDTSRCDEFRGNYDAGDGTLRLKNEITIQLECANQAGSGHVWTTGVRMTLKGTELTLFSTTARRSAAPDQATYDGAAQVFVFQRTSEDPGPEPTYTPEP